MSCDLLSDFLTLRIYTTLVIPTSCGTTLWFAFRFFNFTDIHNELIKQIYNTFGCDLLSDFLTLRIYTTTYRQLHQSHSCDLLSDFLTLRIYTTLIMPPDRLASCDLLSDFLTLRIYTTCLLRARLLHLLWFAFRFFNFTDIHNK